MKSYLEDIFKTKEPSNYVEQSSQTSSPLEAFFAERTPRPSAPAEATPKAAAKIEEPQVEKIYQEYSPEMTDMYSAGMESQSMQQSMQQPSAASSQFVPVSDVIDVEKIKKQAEVLAPRETDWKDALANLTPLAVEALLGKGGGASLGIAGQSIMGDIAKRGAKRDSLEAKLMELKQLRQPKTDLEAGRQARFEAAQKEKRSLADRQTILDTRNRLNQDKTWQSATKRYESTNDVINILGQRNWAGDAGVGYQIAKGIFGEVGALTEQERTQFLSNPTIGRKYSYLQEKFLKTGRFTEEDRADLVSLATALREQSKTTRGRIANSYVEGARSVGVDASGVINPLLKTQDVEFKDNKKSGAGVKTMYDKKTGEPYKVKLNSKTGKYEYVD
jgi:hypothetical protein